MEELRGELSKLDITREASSVKVVRLVYKQYLNVLEQINNDVIENFQKLLTHFQELKIDLQKVTQEYDLDSEFFR